MMRDASFFGIEKYVAVDSTEYGRIILLAFPVYFKYNELMKQSDRDCRDI